MKLIFETDREAVQGSTRPIVCSVVMVESLRILYCVFEEDLVQAVGLKALSTNFLHGVGSVTRTN